MTERLYYADSYQTRFDAEVTEIQELSRINGQSLWRIALNRSAFYPTGGGQPHDTGTLIATARSGAELAAEIVDVEEDEQGEIWHHTAKPLLPGTAVRGTVNIDRRLDHIQQHSGQHLISAALFQVCGARTVSFHLGEAVSTIDLAVTSLEDTALRQAEELANRIIAENRPVITSKVSREQAEAWLASGELLKLPPREGEIRIVQITGGPAEQASVFDRNACGGTHVCSTGQIGGLYLRGTEKVRSGWRMEFVCGLRAMRTAQTDLATLTEAGRLLSVGLAEVPEAVRRLQAEEKRAAKQVQTQTVKLAGYRAEELLREIPIKNGLRMVRLQLTSTDCDRAADAKLLTAKLASMGEKTVAIVAWSPPRKTEPVTVILSRSTDLNFDCGQLLRTILSGYDGRGGGSDEMAQGSAARENLSSIVDALAAGVRED